MIGIIGGTGFIGLNLSWHLQKEGLTCRTFSRNGLLLSPNSIYYPRLSKVEHVQGDFRQEKAVNEFVAQSRWVVLLVSHLLPSSSAEEIKTITSWFTKAFGQLLESCLTHKIDKIVFVSSGGTIYGENNQRIPVKENHPLNAQSAYGSFCALLEQIVETFHHERGLGFTILRVGNPYGPLKRPNTDQGLIDHFIRAARTKRSFSIFGDGSEVRDYIYVDDVSESISRVLLSPAHNDTFNVGTGIGHTTYEVIDLVRKQFSLPQVPTVFRNRRLGEVRCSLLDMQKFERLYQFRCNTSLEEGLRRYAELEVTSSSSKYLLDQPRKIVSASI